MINVQSNMVITLYTESIYQQSALIFDICAKASKTETLDLCQRGEY